MAQRWSVKQYLLAGIYPALILLVSWSLLSFPSWVTFLFEHGQKDLLSFLAHGVYSLPENYIGILEENLVGPLAQVFFFVFFAKFGLRYLRDSSTRVFAVAVFLFLVITKFEVLFFPVYGGDAITGPFTEAIWLKKHHFDYVGLCHQAGYTQGGPKVYVVSLYPTFLALQMLIFPSTKIFFLVNHLLVFALVAGMTAFFRELATRVSEKKTALLAALVFLAFPQVQSQTEMVNMEMPHLFFIFLSTFWWINNRRGLSGLAAVMAVLIKGTGLIACLAYLTLAVLGLFSGDDRPRKIKTLGVGLVVFVTGLLVGLISAHIQQGGSSIGSVQLLRGVVFQGHLKNMVDVFLLATAGFLAHIIVDRRRLAKEGALSFARFLKDNRVITAIWVYAAMWYVLFANYSTIAQRYKLSAFPFLIFLGCFLIRLIFRSPKRQRQVLVFAMIVAACAGYGLFYDKTGNYNYVEIERSMEYRTVLKRDIRLARFIEKKFPSAVVAAPSVIVHFLALPEVGYVKKPFEVLGYGIPSAVDEIPVFKGLRLVDQRNTVWVGLEDRLAQQSKKFFPYPVDPRDIVLARVFYGEKEAIVFKGGIAIEKMNQLMLWQRMMLDAGTKK